MSRHSTFPLRPPSEQLCDLHVYKVPLDLWRAPFNNILNQSVTETVSLGIIRVSPDLALYDIRGEIDKQLEEQAPKDYVFLRSVGRSITRVKSRQEYEWTAKHFLPPKHYAPELYILEATPELRDALAISDRSSQLSPVSMQQGSPGARSYRNGYRHGYPDHGSSPRSPSPHRKGAGSKSYRANGGGYEREAAYTNNTNEDSGVAGMSPDNQHKHRDNYFRAANGKPHDQGRYKQEEEEEERRRLQELEERAQAERNRWEQDERRRREEEDRQREEARRRAEEEEEEERRKREEDEERRRLEEEEDRRREAEKRRLEEEEELRRRNEEEEEEERRRKEEEERRRQEEEDRLKNGSEEEMDGYPSPPQMQTSSPDLDRQRDTQSAQRERAEEQKKLLEELQEARDNRQSTEKEREDLVKKAKTLQSRTQNRRNQARDVWKKRYFEEKKKTPPLEDQTNRLREELDALHRKLMAALEGPKEKNVKAGDNLPSQRNNYIIQCTRLQHDIDDMKRRVENAKMKLTAEMKLRHQADGEARLLRGELTKEKIKLSQTRHQHFAALSPWMMGSTPVPSIPQGKDEAESAAA